ncbi:hypothetical protein [Tahibacter harae]|uniref:CHAP domain-containing protein n=1 Tax=Tahibacter harae TaxID=2963937 RepID=A0ABT1QYA1_9GAMM|nr:hypothetical protein [Tahibacter harae]MCQ4167269.1 hypothetical protein [Tahibacter harae]
MPSPNRPGPLGLDSNNCMIDFGTLMRVVTPCPTMLPELPPQEAAKPVAAAAGVPGYSVDAAVKHINANAHSKSQQQCGKYVRLAIAKGGANFPQPYPGSAKDYGPVLSKLGFSKVPSEAYAPQRGDVVIFQGNSRSKHGHAQMWNGTEWVSDFRQGTDIYPGQTYRSEKTAYEIFRP